MKGFQKLEKKVFFVPQNWIAAIFSVKHALKSEHI